MPKIKVKGIIAPATRSIKIIDIDKHFLWDCFLNHSVGGMVDVLDVWLCWMMAVLPLQTVRCTFLGDRVEEDRVTKLMKFHGSAYNGETLQQSSDDSVDESAATVSVSLSCLTVFTAMSAPTSPAVLSHKTWP